MSAPIEMQVVKAPLASQQQNAAEMFSLSSAPIEVEHFDEKKGFIQKVLGIVTFQLIVTFFFALIASASSNFGAFCQHPATMAIALVGYIVGVIIALCVSRQVPWNYIGLWMVTISMSLLVSAITSVIDWQIVLAAIGITMIMSTALTLFSLVSTKEQLAEYLLFVLCMWVVELVMALLICMGNAWAEPFYYSLGALIYGLYLVIDVYRLKETSSVDDYIPAAIVIYLDIIRIFLYILEALGKAKK
jgi:FtsH-binding integral membrane protein